MLLPRINAIGAKGRCDVERGGVVAQGAHAVDHRLDSVLTMYSSLAGNISGQSGGSIHHPEL